MHEIGRGCEEAQRESHTLQHRTPGSSLANKTKPSTTESSPTAWLAGSPDLRAAPGHGQSGLPVLGAGRTTRVMTPRHYDSALLCPHPHVLLKVLGPSFPHKSPNRSTEVHAICPERPGQFRARAEMAVGPRGVGVVLCISEPQFPDLS